MNSRYKMLASGITLLTIAGTYPVDAANYDPYTYIRTRATPGGGAAAAGDNRIVEGMLVEFWDEDFGLDEYMGSDYTNAAGLSQVFYIDFIEAPDVYTIAKYKFSAIDGKEVEVRNDGSGTYLQSPSAVTNNTECCYKQYCNGCGQLGHT